MSARATWITDAVRTPIGKHGGRLAHKRGNDLAAASLAALTARTTTLDPVDDLALGAVDDAGQTESVR